MSLLALLLAPPLVASLLAIVITPYRRFVGWANVLLAGITCAAAFGLCVQVLTHGTAVGDPGSAWRVDALSALLAACIAVVTLLAVSFGPGLERDEALDALRVRRFRIFANAFAATMLLAVTTQNLAMMWVAIEATTITSAVVIPLERTKSSVEASWKYLLICSVGIALAFAGTVLAYFDFISTAGALPGALNWTVLRATAPRLHPELMQLAFVFVLVGYGTKAGLAPMHTWLPDAHSEAPSAISAMMSGVLLAVAMYAIARWKAVIDASAAHAFAGALLRWVGLVSAAVGAFSLVIQRHYKRMLAYSSVEHMGLVGLGLTLGPLGAFAAWLHVVNHAVAKSTSFLLAGRVLHRYGTTELARVSGLSKAMPWTAGLFTVSILALVGLPPFGLFVSEFLLVRAAFASGRIGAAAIVLVLLLTAFVSLIAHLNRMLYGDVPPGVAVGERRTWPLVALAACAGLLIVLGTVLPAGLSRLIDLSVAGLSR